MTQKAPGQPTEHTEAQRRKAVDDAHGLIAGGKSVAAACVRVGMALGIHGNTVARWASKQGRPLSASTALEEAVAAMPVVFTEYTPEQRKRLLDELLHRARLINRRVRMPMELHILAQAVTSVMTAYRLEEGRPSEHVQTDTTTPESRRQAAIDEGKKRLALVSSIGDFRRAEQAIATPAKKRGK